MEEIKFDDNNYRVHNEKNKRIIKKSLNELGAGRSILIDNDNVIIAGNGVKDAWGNRPVKIIETNGEELIAIKRIDLNKDDKKRKTLALIDNHASDTSEFDTDLVNEDFDSNELNEWEFDAGFSNVEANEDNYEIPDEIKTDIVLGDLFEIGQHRLLCGDSTNSDDVAKLMNGQKADMVFTDPPYGVNYEGGLNKKKRDKLIGDENGELYHGVLSAALPFCKSSAAWYLWFAGTIGKPVYEAVESAGMKVRAMIVWNKQNAHYGNFMAQYMQKHEPCLYCFKDSPKWYGATNEVTVWDVIQPAKNEHHPTQKPVELAVRGINNSSKEEDIIIDFFLGSGTTMVASHQLNRKCYGMEIDPKYCQVIVDRMKKLDPSIEIKRNGIVI